MTPLVISRRFYLLTAMPLEKSFQPVVSVVVAVYNAAPYLADCLNSILKQSLREIEVICVNDGSTDTSGSILQQFAAKDPRIVVIKQKKQGLSVARNTGIEHARAPWICFVDSDDKIGWMGVTKGDELQQLQHYATDEVDAVSGNCCYLDEQNQVLTHSADWFVNRRLGIFAPTAETLRYCNVTARGKLYRRSIFEQYTLRFPVNLRYEDNGFSPKFFAVCRKFSLTPVYFYSYYKHKNTIMAQSRAKKTAENGLNYLEIVRSNLAFFNQYHLTELFLPFLQQHSYELYKDALLFSPSSCEHELKTRFLQILNDAHFSTAGNAGLTALTDSSSPQKTDRVKPIHLQLKQAKRFDGNLFNCFSWGLQQIVNPPKRTLVSRVLNTIINYYGARVWNRTVRKPQLDPKSAKLDRVFFRIQDFILKMRDVDVVTFDVFDTLLVRSLQKPTDVFRLIEVSRNVPGFAEARIQAEQRARKEVDAEDVTLQQIYVRLAPRFQSLKSVELEQESKLLQRNPYVYDLYLAALQQGKRVAAISDMYLPSEFLHTVLVREGYDRLSVLIVSNEWNSTKSSGRLFPKAAQELGCAPKRILHVGDNERADFKMALKAGYQAVLIPQVADRLSGDLAPFASSVSAVQGSVHNALVLEHADHDDMWQKYGYMLGGPIVLAFLYWVKKLALLNGNDHIAFVGRDGWILYQIYRAFFNKDPKASSYVYLPRTISLLSTLSHNRAPYYLEYILEKANGDGVPVKVESSLADNLEEFHQHEKDLLAWSLPQRNELQKHFSARIGNTARSVAFVDLTSMWLTSFTAGHSILGSRNTSNYVLWFFGDLQEADIRSVPYEAAINPKDRVEVTHINQNTMKGVNIVNIMETLISSPEERVIALKDGEPVYGGSGAKEHYLSVARGIQDYVTRFHALYGADAPFLVFTVEEAVPLLSA